MADRGSGHTPLVEFGIVNFNGGDALKECVQSIRSQEGPDCRVRVFDNASSDGSAAAAAESFPEVDVVRSARNLGYAGALNRLLERAESPIVVLCNMDLVFDPGWAAAVLAALDADPAADAVATLVLEATDPPVVNSLGVRFSADLHAQNVGSGERYSPAAVARAREGAFGSYGAVMCFRREALGELEFDEDYFLFFEETDFFLRFHLLGHRTVYSEGAVARHQRSLTTRRYSPLKLYYGERNRLTTVFKLLPVWYWPISILHTLLRLARLAKQAGGAKAGAEGAVRAAMPSKLVIVRTLLRAWSGALVRLPGTLRKRRRFWRRAPGSPRDALALMRSHALSPSDLTLR
jgi:GT2 family glycosyltransferase